jgi:chemotaxis protein CheZ
MTAPELENSKVDRAQLIETFSAFVEGLIDKDHGKVEKHLLELSAQGDSSLYQKVGEMARGLHNSISDLRDDLAPKLTSVTKAVPQATDHLTGVIQMTNDAAHKTMALLDKNSATVEKLRRISVANPIAGLAELVAEAEQTNTEILMAQEFQDLTGQALKKVINVLTDLEKNLVELVTMFGSKAPEPVPASPEAPKAQGKQSQDDADAILASFGF